MELFNSAWLNVREAEIKNGDKPVNNWNYKYYFYCVLRNIKINEIKKAGRNIPESKLNKLTLIEIINDNDDTMPDVWEIESSVLHDWLKRPARDERMKILKNVVTLVIKCKSIRMAYKNTPMSERTFTRHLFEAKREIEYEFTNLTDGHPLTIHDLVRQTSIPEEVED